MPLFCLLLPALWVRPNYPIEISVDRAGDGSIPSDKWFTAARKPGPMVRSEFNGFAGQHVEWSWSIGVKEYWSIAVSKVSVFRCQLPCYPET